MIEERYYTGTPGLTYINEPELAFVTIITVSRNGSIMTEVSGTPTGNEFKYTSTGRIDFSYPISETAIDIGSSEILVPEKIYVKYKV